MNLRLVEGGGGVFRVPVAQVHALRQAAPAQLGWLSPKVAPERPTIMGGVPMAQDALTME